MRVAIASMTRVTTHPSSSTTPRHVTHASTDRIFVPTVRFSRRRLRRPTLPCTPTPRRVAASAGGYDSAKDAEDDLLFWNEDDLEDDEPIAIEDDDEDWDDEDEGEGDDDWFFVPSGANVRAVDEDLFNIDDDDDGGGYVMDYVRVPTKNDRAEGRSGVVNTSSRSPRKNPSAQTDASNKKPERIVGESSEISAKNTEKGMSAGDVERMVRMGVPRELLFAIEEEKKEVTAFNKKKELEASRRTHRRMTIVAGKHARRKLLSPSGLDTRPMMSMVRGATFDMILNFLGSRSNVQFPPESRWLDLFCGTGAIGLEAMSRGVVEAHFVEMDPWVINNCTNKNINSLGVSKSTTTHTASVQAFMAQHHKNARGVGGAFDFISFCPPYEKVSYPELLLQLDESALVKDSTVLLVEYAKGQANDILPSIGKRLRRVRDRRYGRTFIALYACDGRDITDADVEDGEVETAKKFSRPVRRSDRTIRGEERD